MLFVLSIYPGRVSMSELESQMAATDEGASTREDLLGAIEVLRDHGLLHPGYFVEPTRAAWEFNRLARAVPFARWMPGQVDA